MSRVVGLVTEGGTHGKCGACRTNSRRLRRGGSMPTGTGRPLVYRSEGDCQELGSEGTGR